MERRCEWRSERLPEEKSCTALRGALYNSCRGRESHPPSGYRIAENPISAFEGPFSLRLVSALRWTYRAACDYETSSMILYVIDGRKESWCRWGAPTNWRGNWISQAHLPNMNWSRLFWPRTSKILNHYRTRLVTINRGAIDGAEA